MFLDVSFFLILFLIIYEYVWVYRQGLEKHRKIWH